MLKQSNSSNEELIKRGMAPDLLLGTISHNSTQAGWGGLDCRSPDWLKEAEGHYLRSLGLNTDSQKA